MLAKNLRLRNYRAFAALLLVHLLCILKSVRVLVPVIICCMRWAELASRHRVVKREAGFRTVGTLFRSLTL